MLGWIGSFLLAVCGLPQACQSLKDGHSNGINGMFLAMWTMGEICTVIYILPKNDGPLMLNYFANLVFLAIIIKYKIKPRK